MESITPEENKVHNLNETPSILLKNVYKILDDISIGNLEKKYVEFAEKLKNDNGVVARLLQQLFEKININILITETIKEVKNEAVGNDKEVIIQILRKLLDKINIETLVPEIKTSFEFKSLNSNEEDNDETKHLELVLVCMVLVLAVLVYHYFKNQVPI